MYRVYRIPKNFKANGFAPKELGRRHPRVTLLFKSSGRKQPTLRVTCEDSFPYPLKP